MIFRLTQKLAAKIKAGKLGQMPLDENQYADWSCNLFTAAGTEYIIQTNTQSLYSTVMAGKGITNERALAEVALNSLRTFMEDDNQTFVYQKFIVPASGTVHFAKALNRSVTASITDHIVGAKVWLAEGGMPVHEVNFRLNTTPLAALGFANPREVFGQLGEQA